MKIGFRADDREDVVEVHVGALERSRSPIEWRLASSAASKPASSSSVACSAAWRASPASKKMRAFWKFCTPPGCGEQVAGRAAQGVDDELRRRAGDAGALAGADLDEPHLAQVQQRLADRGAADAEVAHQLALGGQPVGFGERAVLDHPLEVLRNVLGQPPLSDQRRPHLAYLLYQTRTLSVSSLDVKSSHERRSEGSRLGRPGGRPASGDD